MKCVQRQGSAQVSCCVRAPAENTFRAERGKFNYSHVRTICMCTCRFIINKERQKGDAVCSTDPSCKGHAGCSISIARPSLFFLVSLWVTDGNFSSIRRSIGEQCQGLTYKIKKEAFEMIRDERSTADFINSIKYASPWPRVAQNRLTYKQCSRPVLEPLIISCPCVTYLLLLLFTRP